MMKPSGFTPQQLRSPKSTTPSALILYSVLFICAAESAFAGQKGTWRDSVDLIMRSVEDLNQKGALLTVTGLRDASSSNWPGSFYAWRDGSRCSATLIGPAALLLPTQCMPNGGEVVIEFRGVRKPGTCRHSQTAASTDRSAFALCVLSTPIEGIQFDTVNINPARIRRGRALSTRSSSDGKTFQSPRPIAGKFRTAEPVGGHNAGQPEQGSN